MSMLLHKLRLVRDTKRLYRDHVDSLTVYSQTTGADVDLDDVKNSLDIEIQNIIDNPKDYL
jgi:hypothetical protein